LKPVRIAEDPREHQAITFEEILMIARAPVKTNMDERVRAAAIFWFLSGIRVSAFVTLPIKAVKLDELRVDQWPMMGVHTKFGKHATTYLFNIPELLAVVRRWDKEVRAVLPEDSYWFAPCSPDTGELDPTIKTVGKHRHHRARKDLKDWCQRVDLPYYSPHKFRHGHEVYAIKRAKDIQALKAVSQNLMHSNISNLWC
jgi:integrase/recombinase XerD